MAVLAIQESITGEREEKERMRKILVSLLVAAMVLGLVGTAFAGFSDTAGHADAKYIDKATAFGWLKGYPDGSFKPAGNITRAEFCAVVVRALGLEAAAGSTAGLATKFSDVPATHWAAGYINVATNKGIIKGYPDGTFKPEANVTNAEAITMIVRALNREADAVGEWPVGHITVAASVNVIGTGFVSNALATRADVARYIAKAADVKHKELTTNGWIESTDKTFLKYNNLEKITGDVTNTDSVNKTVTMNVGGVSNTFTLADNYAVANNVSLIDLKGYNVDAYKNKDTAKLVFIEPSTTSTVKKGSVRAAGIDGNGTKYLYLYDDTTKYIGAANASVIRNGVASTWDKLAVDDEVTFFIGTDGNVSYVNARGYWKYRAIVADMYTAGTPQSLTIRFWDSTNNRFTTATLVLDTNCKVELNGADAKFTDLKKGDVVSVAVSDPNNPTTATIINASNKTVTGKVTAKRTTVSEDLTRYFMSIDGVEYRFESTTEVKDSDTYSTAVAVYNQVKVGQTVTITLSQRGRIRVTEFVSGVADMGRIKRFVTNTSGSYDSWVLDMKGTEATYEVAKDSSGNSKHTALTYYQGVPIPGGGTGLFTGVNPSRTLRPGDYVALTLDTDNRITGVELLVNPLQYVTEASVVELGDVFSGDKIVTIRGAAYLVTNDTLLYVNDAPGSMASVAKGQKAAVAYSTTQGDIKLRALIVDTSARMDAAAITVTVNSTTNKVEVKGWDKATEPWSKVEVQYNGTTITGAVDISDDAGGYKAPHNTSARSSTGYNGGFAITNIAYGGQLGSGALRAADTLYKGDQIVVKVTDRFGNVTSATFIVP